MEYFINDYYYLNNQQKNSEGSLSSFIVGLYLHCLPVNSSDTIVLFSLLSAEGLMICCHLASLCSLTSACHGPDSNHFLWTHAPVTQGASGILRSEFALVKVDLTQSQALFWCSWRDELGATLSAFWVRFLGLTLKYAIYVSNIYVIYKSTPETN